MNCRFVSMYRDGANYKRHGSVVVHDPDGLGLVAAAARLRVACSSGDDFNAAQVGLPELFFDDGIDDDDHSWHEFVALEITDEAATDSRSLETLVESFEAARQLGWRIDAERLGGSSRLPPAG